MKHRFMLLVPRFLAPGSWWSDDVMLSDLRAAIPWNRHGARYGDGWVVR